MTIHTTRLRATLIATLSAGALYGRDARADGSWASVGYIGSAVFGTTPAGAHGVEASFMYYESSRDWAGLGVFGQSQHYSGSPGHGRHALGLQAGGLAGAELGVAYRATDGEHASTTGLHVGPYVSLGFVYTGMRFTIPFSKESSGPGYGYEAALTLGIKFPYAFGSPPPTFAHGRPLWIDEERSAPLVGRADWC